MFNKNIFFTFSLATTESFSDQSLKNKHASKNQNEFLIIWLENNISALLSGRLLFYSIKKEYPESKITLIVKKKWLPLLRNYEHSDLLCLSPDDNVISVQDYSAYLFKQFAVALIPSLNSFKFLDHFLSRIVFTKNRIGVSKIDSKRNPYSLFFNNDVKLKFDENPDVHYLEFMQSLLKPIEIKKKSGHINFEEIKKFSKKVKNPLEEFGIKENQKIIVINNEPEEASHRWSIQSLVTLIDTFTNTGDYFFFYVEHEMEEDVKKILESEIEILHYVNKFDYEKLLKIFSFADLFITCDSEVMFLGGVTGVSQISIFGNSNPFHCAPIGKTKKFIKKSYIINDVSAQDVFELSQKLLTEK